MEELYEKEEVQMSKIYSKTFLWMFMGIFATTILAAFCYYSGFTLSLTGMVSLPVILLVELVVVVIFSLLFNKMSAQVVAVLFFVYAVLNGITLSVLLYAFELNSIIYCFGAASLLFLVLAIIGAKTSIDISRFAPILFISLGIAIILSIVNIFLGNSILDLAINWGVLIIMAGITMYDMQKIKMLAQSGKMDPEKIHIYSAMQLYLDFINIFVRILSIFGNRK